MKCLTDIISKVLYGKVRASIFVFTMFLMAIILIYPQRTQGREIYSHTNTHGIKVASNTPISEKHEKKVQKTSSLNTNKPSERRVLENGNKEKQKQYNSEREERGKLLLLYSIFR
jgi:hypothetical protein